MREYTVDDGSSVETYNGFDREYTTAENIALFRCDGELEVFAVQDPNDTADLMRYIETHVPGTCIPLGVFTYVGDRKMDDLTAKVKKAKRKVWMGGTECNICTHECGEYLVDGATKFGPWAVMCGECFKNTGVGIGQGSGQRYQKQGDDYVKVEG